MRHREDVQGLDYIPSEIRPSHTPNFLNIHAALHSSQPVFRDDNPNDRTKARRRLFVASLVLHLKKDRAIRVDRCAPGNNAQVMGNSPIKLHMNKGNAQRVKRGFNGFRLPSLKLNPTLSLRTASIEAPLDIVWLAIQTNGYRVVVNWKYDTSQLLDTDPFKQREHLLVP